MHPPPLYEDILQKIAHELSSDLDTQSLGRLCQVSKLCMHIARHGLYHDLDLVNGDNLDGASAMIRSLGPTARQLRRSAVQASPHLLAYARSLYITLQKDSILGVTPPSNTPFETLLLSIAEATHNISSVNIIFGDRNAWGRAYDRHFRVVESVRRPLEAILTSTTMRALGVDLCTVTSISHGDNGPFPGWIFRCASQTVTRLQLRVHHTLAHAIIPTAFALDAPPIRAPLNAPKRMLEELVLVTSPEPPKKFNTMSRYTSVLSGLCFNIALDRLRRLVLRHPNLDETLWALAVAASGLDDLTILDYPNSHDNLGLKIPSTHFSRFTALQSLTLHLTFHPQNVKCDSIQSIVDLFSVPTPPTLRVISLVLSLGRYVDRQTPALLKSDAGIYVRLPEWLALDEKLAGSLHTSLQVVCFVLAWSSKRSGTEEDYDVRISGVELERNFRKLLTRTDGRGILRVDLTHGTTGIVNYDAWESHSRKRRL